MPKNAISKTTVTQPDDQGTPKKAWGPTGHLRQTCFDQKQTFTCPEMRFRKLP